MKRHYKGDDHEGLQQVICRMASQVRENELNSNCKVTSLESQNSDLVWTRGLTNFLQGIGCLKQGLVSIYEKCCMTCNGILESVENLLCFALLHFPSASSCFLHTRILGICCCFLVLEFVSSSKMLNYASQLLSVPDSP